MTYGAIPVDIAGVPDPLPQALHVLDVREDLEWQHGHIEAPAHPAHGLPGRLGGDPGGAGARGLQDQPAAPRRPSATSRRAGSTRSTSEAGWSTGSPRGARW